MSEESVLQSESTPGITHTTACEHYWVEDIEQDPNSTLVSVRCTKCWAGCMINPSEVVITDGVMRSQPQPSL